MLYKDARKILAQDVCLYGSIIAGSKLCESGTRIRDIVNSVSFEYEDKIFEAMEEYFEKRDFAVSAEERVLSSICFEIHKYKSQEYYILLMTLTNMLKLPPQAIQLSWSLLNERSE